jgi:type II secretion system protein N
MTENERNEELVPAAPPQVERNWQTTLKQIAPYAAGFVAFLFGLLVFAPLEAYAMLALRQLSASGIHVDVAEMSLSAFGRFNAQSIKIPFGTAADKQAALKIAEAKGRISLLGALMGDRYDANAEAVILSFTKGDFGLKIDSLEITSALEQSKSGGTGKTLNGTLALQADLAQATYKENKFLKEEIVVPFMKIVFKLRAQQNQIAIETGEAMGRLINAQVKGSITMGTQTELNLNIVLKPTNEFYEKYQDKDLRTLLKFANILQDDGRIEFNVRGNLGAPIVEAVTLKAGLPPTTP